MTHEVSLVIKFKTNLDPAYWAMMRDQVRAAKHGEFSIDELIGDDFSIEVQSVNNL